MTAKKKLLADYVEVQGRFSRSTHLEKDFRDASKNEDYIITPTARESLHRLSEGLNIGASLRAWTLTGPYGVGKSAFAVFLTQLLCSHSIQGELARTKLEETDPQLASRLRKIGIYGKNSKGFLPVLVTARRAAASVCLAEGILAAAKASKSRKLMASTRSLKQKLQAQSHNYSWDSREIVESIASLSKTAVADGYLGILIVIDELGKLFEYAARNPQMGDVFILQELAEQAARSAGNPIVLVGLLHQSFQEYGLHLDAATRREWAKIQGRFEDIAFLEPPEQVIRMISKAIRWKGKGANGGRPSYASKISKLAKKAGIVPPAMQSADFQEASYSAYPLHPVTLVALPFIFRRFAQNERSLFSYLSSLEPYGFQEFTKTHSLDQKTPSVLRLSDLFDYFTKSFGAGLYRHPHALRWIEAADILERKVELTQLQQEIIKTVGVLNALGEFCHLNATEEIVSLALTDSTKPSKNLSTALKELRESSLITYRKFNNTYRIWEGSDVDIEQRISEGYRKIRQGLNLAESVRRYIPSRHLVARRHSFKTGALRYFAVEYIDNPETISSQFNNRDSASDGKVIVCLAESPQAGEQFRRAACQEKERIDIVFAIPQLIGELRSVATELGSLKWAWENTPELRDDRVARRELSLRITEADQLLQRLLQGLMDPREEPVGSGCLWIHSGKEIDVRSPAEVSQLLSDVCDKIYHEAPIIRNELIARRALSSAATSARRILLEKMLNNSAEECLGIVSYPPERSIYESVLRATGLHYQKKDSGEWGLRAPPKRNPARLRPCWDKLEKTIFSSKIRRIELADLFSTLADAPYGLPNGLHPIVFTAFYLLHQDELFLYREDTFVPDVTAAHLELLQRRPDLFSVSGARLTGTRKAVVERLAHGLKEAPKTASVVRKLYRVLNTLPEVTKKTAKIEDRAVIKMRDCLFDAASPEQLLFDDLPSSFGLKPFKEGEERKEDMDRFFKQLNNSLSLLNDFASTLLADSRDLLLLHCDLPQGMEGWHELERRATWLAPRTKHEVLTPFLNCVNNGVADNHNARPTLSLIANRPFEQWSDMDIQSFDGLAQGIGELFRQTWHNYGDTGPALSEKELKRKELFRKKLETQVKAAKGISDSRSLAAALRELLIQVEKNC